MRPKSHRITVWVTAREAFWIAAEALRSHKLRSFLTLLGVVIATTTLIVVMSVVNGMNLYIQEHIANLGTNTFVLHQFQWAQSFDTFLQARRRNQPIRIEDYEYLRDNLQGYLQIGAMANLSPNPPARYKSHSIEEITLNGMTASFADIGREKIQYGRYLSESDYQHNARVCVIGQDLVEKLFPNIDPLEKEVSIGGPAVPRHRRRRKSRQHLRAERGQFRLCASFNGAQHLAGPSRAAGVHQSAGRQPHDGIAGRSAGPDARPAPRSL